jgi:hypothetical protein
MLPTFLPAKTFTLPATVIMARATSEIKRCKTVFALEHTVVAAGAAAPGKIGAKEIS